MILSFLVSYIMKHPHNEFKLLGPTFVQKFFQKYPKMTIFCIFVFYYITSNGHTSAIFMEIWIEIFYGTSEDVIITK